MHTVKVLVTGSFCTGKTTCIEASRKLLTAGGVRAAAAIEPSRTCPFPLNERQGLSSSLWLMGRLITEEIEATSENTQVLFCDGGAPAILAHTAEVWNDSRADVSALMALAMAWQRTYDLVLWSRDRTSVV